MRPLAPALVVLASLGAAFVVATRVRLSPDIAALLPDRGEAASLAAYARAFGGGDPGLVLVEGDDPAEVERAAAEAAARLSAPDLGRAYHRIDLDLDAVPPSRWLLLAGPSLRDELQGALSPAGMRARLAETKALLLAPGSAALAPQIARDPLRLGQLVAAHRGTPGRKLRSDGALATDDGKARLVVVEPSGNALRSDQARSFVDRTEALLDPIRREHPALRLRLTGGHALAAATEAMLRSDLLRSSILSLALSALAFAAGFRRLRALLAIVPPLCAGALLAAAAAALFPAGISGVAVAFASVVLGVGMDTGVHVYAAVREAMAEGAEAPVAQALDRVTRPVLGAAAVAAGAFACLGLSRVEALRQLGLLSAAGELTTALCIWALTPWIAAWLERSGGPLPAPPRWASWLARAASWRGGRAASLAAGALVVAGLWALGPPATSAGLVAIRPAGLAPAGVYEAIAKTFQDSNEAPWVVLARGPSEDAVRTRIDALHEALAAQPSVAGPLEALTPWAPSDTTLASRLRERDALGLAARADDLENALRDTGFSVAPFRKALDDLRAPAPPSSLPTGALRSRFVARDGDAWVAVLHAHPPDPAALASLVRRVDPAAAVTGYPSLEPALREALSGDLPRVAACAAALVLLGLSVAVRRPRDMALAAAVIGAELGCVLLGMRLLSIPLHLYDALVLPVLLGITVDEVLFVLGSLRRGGRLQAAIEHEAPLVATTALTTAAGFGALLVCRFEPLRHLGAVAALGSLTGLLLALLVVPAWARPES